MAKKDTNNTEKTFNAVAKQFIKYGGEHLKAGDKFQIKESDIKELSMYAEIEIPKEDENNQVFNEEDGKQGDKVGE
ncbi:hypothetical protein P9J83_15745 [Clostridium sporogenes]|uniref:DUF7210 domain-containing protein n=1 Tax=Clostridium sporogenes TaxID=1509 RepID=A0AAE4FNM9_CLOSG|nr:hypothetical protein [Clostridium sporogenes]MDS1004937.1 hypothetical protein [Clostridium sporogenes]